MANFLLQRGLRRSRAANRVGITLLIALLLALVASLIHGIRTLML
ncbi:MAG: hypothetical protein IANPNBLG_01022 [Bryobacteraceae bacterium]|nr:hypothetical protein [Bryobacteraceae bacterium]